MIATLHGNGGCAEQNFLWWHSTSEPRNYALVALQYAEEDVADEDPKEEHLFDGAATIYANLEAILDDLQVYCPLDDTTVVLHGFSRGSALSYQLALMDRGDDGLQAFSTFVCDSGGPGPAGCAGTVPEYLQDAPPDVYSGAHFWLYCGELDYDGQRCEDMAWMMEIILAHDGTVDDFYKNPMGGHGIFITGEPGDTGPALTALFDYIDTIEPAPSGFR